MPRAVCIQTAPGKPGLLVAAPGVAPGSPAYEAGVGLVHHAALVIRTAAQPQPPNRREGFVGARSGADIKKHQQPGSG